RTWSGVIGKEARLGETGVGGCKTEGSSVHPDGEAGGYADRSLLRGVELNSGRDVLLTLEEILSSRKP
ncbi:MAG: hypothetical protein ABJB49_01150, partial [Nitrospirota bacterium]